MSSAIIRMTFGRSGPSAAAYFGPRHPDQQRGREDCSHHGLLSVNGSGLCTHVIQSSQSPSRNPDLPRRDLDLGCMIVRTVQCRPPLPPLRKGGSKRGLRPKTTPPLAKGGSGGIFNGPRDAQRGRVRMANRLSLDDKLAAIRPASRRRADPREAESAQARNRRPVEPGRRGGGGGRRRNGAIELRPSWKRPSIASSSIPSRMTSSAGPRSRSFRPLTSSSIRIRRCSMKAATHVQFEPVWGGRKIRRTAAPRRSSPRRTEGPGV